MVVVATLVAVAPPVLGLGTTGDVASGSRGSRGVGVLAGESSADIVMR
jgi:hypothetical protein